MAPPEKKNKSYEDRKKTLMKKASELATLCAVPVCVVCVNPDSTTETWPKEREEAVKVLETYKSHPNIRDGSKKQHGKGKEKVVSSNKAPRVFETWDSRFDYLPEESLMGVMKILDKKLEVVNQVVGEIPTAKKRKVLHNESKSKLVHYVNGDGGSRDEVGLNNITRNFLDSVSLNLTHPYTGNYSDIYSFSGRISEADSDLGRISEGGSDLGTPVLDLELRL